MALYSFRPWVYGLACCLSISPAVHAQDEIRNSGNLRIHSGANMAVYGDLTNNGTFTSNSGTIYYVGSALQTIDGSNTPDANNFIINNSNGIQLDVEYQISGSLTFTDGIITTNRANSATEFVNFLDNATVSGMADDKHVDGVVRKTGDDAFTFPVGDGGRYMPLTITAPSVATDIFTAQYIYSDPDPTYDATSREGTLYNVSRVEYWLMDRTNGSSDVTVTLSFVTSSGVLDLPDLVVARWDGTKWVDEGNGGTTGDKDDGTVASAAAVTSFGSAFAIGTITSDNPLPIQWLDFIAYYQDHDVKLNWTTATEINNDHFTIERSRDGVLFEEIGTVRGKGNSSTISRYASADPEPYKGESYYRIKQTDYDGTYTYSAIRPVNIGLEQLADIVPNPATSDNISLQIASDHSGDMRITVFDAGGRLVYDNTVAFENGRFRYAIQPERVLSPGLYTLVGQSGQNLFQKKFMIR
ncbi:MAG: T9SS type A sorting domain-containing protein [Flavobacteriales bacterium]|nr:T9SS type A sorting domain-containing protein [Flavobacteriales bacterium]MCB9448343.1 T9SS type A sorting domain-containing protein [Flavobacteriales bacterium]